MSELQVTANGDLVGTLSFDEQTGSFGFAYAPGWLAGGGFLLAPCLTPEACASAGGGLALHAFLGNLLPEGQALDDVAAAARLSKANLYGLLRYLGRESAGALAFIEPDSPPVLAARREIHRDELSQRIRDRDVTPFQVWDGKVRLSIAGVQDKIAVLKDGERLYLADGPLASTHVLKPAPRNPQLSHLVVNEHFCMGLAARVKLPVAPVALLRVPEPVLLVQRFDRALSDPATVQRIHIIDACQALGLPASHKYERNFGGGRDVQHIRDGVSLPQLFSLMRYVHHKAEGKLALLRWALFQYLIGNSDAHGKNLSFFMRGHALVQAPAYDLVCVERHPAFEREAAMAIGDAFDYESVGAFDWAQFAVACQLPRQLVRKEMENLAARVSKDCQLTGMSSVYQADELDYLQPVEALIQARTAKMLSDAPKIPKIGEAFLRGELEA